MLAAADGSDEGTPVGGIADVLQVTSSPDGQHLAFLGRTERSSRACLDPAPAQPLGLYVAAGDGTGVRRMADVPAAAHTPVLSPDGRTAAVLDMGDDTPVPTGRDWCAPGEVRLVLIDNATGTSRVVTGMTEIAGPPRFSRDGATVVLEGGDFATTPARDLVFVDVASANAQRLSTPETVETGPVFSPDGERLAVLRHTTGEDPASTAEIAVGAADGTEMATVAATGTEDFDLAWTPDGTHLGVAGAVITPDCGETDDASSASAPPGGCDTATATTDIRLVDADGGELRQVSDTVSWSDAGLTFAP